MSEKNRCPKCGVRLPTDAPEGLCPKCLMKVAMSEGAEVTMESPRIEGPGTMIGRYKLLELIGEGGMGLVYLAEQQEPIRRRVALKIVKLGMDTKQVIARFEAEKQMLALLDHPNIARVYDAGTTEAGRPYFVMEYVKGQAITEYCDQHKTGIEDRLKLFRQVCEGVQYAHQKGIIHRDIKPSNILVTVEGDRAVPKIIDFGIAKAVTQQFTEGTLFTQQGQLLGTPEYMSPEQTDLATQDIDTRSDIYSLGVVLYQLLAGVLPFGRESFEKGGFAEIQRIIQEVDPPHPSTAFSKLGDEAKKIAEKRKTQVVPLARRLHRELEWIPLKAMRKERVRRYRSASELADDIQNYLNGNPLLAGPETAIYRVKKFVRRHAGSVATVILVAAAIILGLVISTAMYYRSEKALNREAIARGQAEQAQKVAQEQKSIAETKAEDLRRSMYVNNIQLADAKYKDGNIRRVRELLAACPNDLRGWEWNRLNYISDQSIMTLRGHRGGVISVAMTPDGKLIASGGWDKTIKVWDATTGTELMTIQAHDELVRSVAFSPDGKHIVSSGRDKTARIWDVISGEKIMTLTGHKGYVYSAVYSPDGKRIVSASHDGTIKVWDSTTGTELMTVRGYGAVAYSPDGKRIISAGGSDGKIKVWDAATGAEILVLQHGIGVSALALSPEGTRVVSGGEDGIIKVWDISNGKELMVLRGHREETYSVAFSPDGKRIVSGSDDNTIRIWDASNGAELTLLRGHEGAVLDVVFSPDGKRIVSAGGDNTVKIWDGTSESENMTINTRYTVGDLAFSRDGKFLISGGDNTVTIWNVETGVELKTVHGYQGSLGFGTLSPDGKHIICWSKGWSQRKPIINVWDMAIPIKLMTLRGHEKPIYYVSFSQDGKYIVTGSSDCIIKVWDGSTGDELMTLRGHKEPLDCVAFSPDGKHIATGGFDGIMKVWDASTGAEITTVQHGDGVVHPNQGIWSVAFSHDGKRIVTGGSNDKVKVWDVVTGSGVMTLSVGEDGVLSVAFTPDGRRIVACGRLEAAVRVWDAETGTEVITLRLPGVPYTSLSISPDGKTLAVAYGAATYANTITLFESAPPPGGYEPRRTAEAARKIVGELYEKNNSYYEVINTLRNDKTLDESICQVALKIANARKGEDVYKIYVESRELLSPRGDPNAYRVALEKADKASRLQPNNLEILAVLGLAQARFGAYDDALNTHIKANSLDPNNPVILQRLGKIQYHLGTYEDAVKTLTKANSIDPNQPAILNTLGMVHYRMGLYEDALKTLTDTEKTQTGTDKIRTDTDEVSNPTTVAFIAMALHKLGRTEEAKAALERLRDVLKKDERLARFAQSDEGKALLAEAEKLIEGEK